MWSTVLLSPPHAFVLHQWSGRPHFGTWEGQSRVGGARKKTECEAALQRGFLLRSRPPAQYFLPSQPQAVGTFRAYIQSLPDACNPLHIAVSEDAFCLSLGRPCLVQSAHRKQVHFLAAYVEPPACLQLGSEVAVYRTLNQRSSCEDVLRTRHSHVSVLSVTRAPQVSCDLGESPGIGRRQVGVWVVGTSQNTKKIPLKTGSRPLAVLSPCLLWDLL